jgi:hypothetical protein
VQLKPVEEQVVVLIGVLRAISSRVATEGLPSTATIG